MKPTKDKEPTIGYQQALAESDLRRALRRIVEKSKDSNGLAFIRSIEQAEKLLTDEPSCDLESALRREQETADQLATQNGFLVAALRRIFDAHEKWYQTTSRTAMGDLLALIATIKETESAHLSACPKEVSNDEGS